MDTGDQKLSTALRDLVYGFEVKLTRFRGESTLGIAPTATTSLRVPVLLSPGRVRRRRRLGLIWPDSPEFAKVFACLASRGVFQ
jgi:hypothetical protein